MSNNYQQLKQKYVFWGHLSKFGKKEIGHIFPDRVVPLKTILMERATLEGKKTVHGIYKVDVNLLTETQYNLILEHLHNRSGFSIEGMKQDFKKDGFIPMTSKYISASGTNRLYMFLGVM